MLKNSSFLHTKAGSAVLLIIVSCCIASAWAGQRVSWEREQVDWRITGGDRIKAIDYPSEKPVPTLAERDSSRARVHRRKLLSSEAASRLAPLAEPSSEPIIVSVIDSPPIDGYVPWIVVAITDKRLLDLELDAIPASSVIGEYPPGIDPQSDYAIGIFDTGAGAHVVGHADAVLTGVFNGGLTTSNTIVISGVAGAVDAWVSYPLGLFIDGLGAVENGLLLDTSGMIGETNVAIAVGMGGSPDLPTAIGPPLSVYFATALLHDQFVTVSRDGQDLTSPDIHFYELDDPSIPSYDNVIPLELRPLGGAAVQYIPDISGLFEFPPMTPSVIIGNLAQSLFFVHSVDLVEGDQRAIDKDRFMFDTGAQVTVIGSRMVARLALDPDEPDFEVEIVGVTGGSIIVPGFYIDSVDIPALGEWLSFTNVPVIYLDIASPEGGTLDGIIGMNLFVDYNLVLRGGGLVGQDDPSLEFELVDERLAGDIVPLGGDGTVDFLDLALFAQAWLAIPMSPNWDSRADMIGDAEINFLDFSVLAENWRASTAR